MNDAQKLAIWLEVVKAALMSPSAPPHASLSGHAGSVATFAIDVADRVTRTIEQRGKGSKP